MNKNRFRVIYSQAQSIFIAVAETVKSRTKASGQGTLNVELESDQTIATTYKRLNPLNFAVISCLGAVLISMPLNTMANTHIIADKSAPNNQQPTILNSGNGLVQVNIQTPSAGGVSRNTYKQFDVGQEGAILNNSRNNAQTQIGGWVQGNPWLAKGEAKVILNEVNSSNPSQLKGYLEVAGKQAQVVIANPSGLVCDGCGVINATRFTLTTGQAVMNQGYLESFRVRDGQVTIAGKGLDGSLTPFTDIYSRALKVNAGLYANSLSTVLGQNDIDVRDQAAAKINTATANLNASNDKPNFALDVGQLGGMYAGKIFLVGTEKGLGVRNAGSINATTQQLTLTANGDLLNAGNIIANKDQVQITAGNVTNTGNMSSSTSRVTLQSQNLENSGLISSADELHLQNQNALNNSGKINAARIVLDTSSLKNNGSIEQTGLQALDLKSGQMSNVGGKIGVAKKVEDGGTGGTGSGSTGGEGAEPTVPKDPAKDGGSLEVVVPKDTTPKTYDAGYIHVKNNFNNDQGAVVANGAIDLVTDQGLLNDQGELGLGKLTVTGDRLSNQNGKIITQAASYDVGHVNNQKGIISSSGVLSIKSRTDLDNSKGQLLAGGDLSLNSQGDLNNSQAIVASDKDVSIKSQSLNNTQGTINSNKNIIIQTGNLNNHQAKIVATQDVNLKSASLLNTDGHIQASSFNIETGDINNKKGVLQTTLGDLNLQAKQIDNGDKGLIYASGDLKLQAAALASSGTVASKKNMSLLVDNVVSNQGQIAASGQIDIHANQLYSSQEGHIAAGAQVDHSATTEAKNLNINTTQATEIHGVVTATADTNIQALDLNIDQATIAANNIYFTIAQSVKAEQAKVQAQKGLTIQTGINDAIHASKAQLSAEKINLNTAKLNNQSGKIIQTGQGSLDLHIADIDNTSGQIMNNGARTNITAKSLNNTLGQITHVGDQGLHINADQLVSKQAILQSNSSVELVGENADLEQAKIIAKSLKTQHDQLTAQQSEIQLGDGESSVISVKDGKLDAAKIQSANQSLSLQAEHGLSLTKASIQTAGKKTEHLNIEAAQLDTSNAQILNTAHTSIQAADWNNTGAQLSADQIDINVKNTIENKNAVVASNKNLNIQADNINNHKGLVQSSQASIGLDIKGTLDNGSSADTAGQMIAQKNLHIQADQVKNAGNLYAKNELITHATTVNNTGLVASENNVQLKLKQLHNTGQLIAGINQQGTLFKQGNLDIDVEQQVQSSGTHIAGDRLILSGAGLALSGSTTQAKQVSLIAKDADINLQKAKLNSEHFAAETATTFNSNEAKISSGSIQLVAHSWTNQSGQVVQTGQDDLNIQLQGDLENKKGVIAANAHQIELAAANIDNAQGLIQQGTGEQALPSDARLNIKASGTLDNTQGQIYTQHVLDLASNHLNNSAGRLQAQQLHLSSNRIDNTEAGIISAGQVQIKSQQLSNIGATIQSTEGQLDIVAQQLSNKNSKENQALIQSKDQSNIQVDQLLNTGTLYSQKDSHVVVYSALNNSGLIAAKNNQDIQSGHLINTGTLAAGLNTDGKLNGLAHLNIHAEQVESSGQHIATGQISISANQAVQLANSKSNAHDIVVQSKAGDVDLSAASVTAAQKLDLNAAQALTTDQATLLSDTLNVNAQKWSNKAATIVSNSENDININIDQGIDFSNSKLISNAKNIYLNTQGDFNHTAGLIQLGVNTEQKVANAIDRHLSIHANNVINDQGTITTVGEQAHRIEINAKQNLSNQNGQITTQGTLSAHANTINNQSGILSAGQSDLTATTLMNNQQGLIDAKQELNIETTDLLNQKGVIQSRQENVQLTAKNLINNGESEIEAGNIHAAKDIALSAAQLKNSGTLYAGHDLNANVKKLMVNTGTMAAKNSIDVYADDIKSSGALFAGLNSDGTFNDTGKLNLTARNLAQATGKNIAGQHITIHASQVDLSQSQTQAQNIALNAQQGDLTLNAATVAANELSLNTSAALNTHKAIVKAHTLDLKAHDWNNQSGVLEHSSTDDLQIDLSGTLNNQAGQIKSNAKQLGLKADQILNQKGEIISYGQQIELTAKDLKAQQSKILANGFVNANITGETNLDEAVLQTHGLSLNTGSLSIEAGQLIDLAGSKASTIEAKQDINNTSGVIVSQNDLVIKAQDLNNQSGQIATTNQKKLDLIVQKQLDNTQGLIKSIDALNISSTDLINNQGIISSQGALTLNHAALLSNQKGLINSQSDLTIQGGAVDNRQGELSSKGGLTLNTQGQKLENEQGVIANAQGTLYLKTGDLDNDNGLIQSAGNLNLDAGNHVFTNSNNNVDQTKGVIVQGDAQIKASTLDNQQGRIQVSGNLDAILDQDVENTQGIIRAKDIDISAKNQINNQKGLIFAQNIQLDTGVLINDGDTGLTAEGSVISADENLKISAREIHNQNTRANNSAQGLQAKSVQITTQDLDNHSGSIRSGESTDIAATGLLNNQLGLISSNKKVQIYDDQAQRTLMLSNEQGTIVADQAVDLKLKSLDGTGQVMTDGDLGVDLQSDYIQKNKDQLLAGGNLLLRTTGQVTNQSELSAGKALHILAHNFENQANAKVAGGTLTDIEVQTELNNHGLINGGDTHLKADVVNNLGAGRIYGDHIAIQADTLNNTPENGVAAVIASRGDMDLGVRILNNNENSLNPQSQALIYSGNDLRIGGSLNDKKIAVDNSEVINNRSAQIEASRNIDIKAKQLNNLTVLYEKELSQTTESLINPGDRLIRVDDQPGRFFSKNNGDMSFFSQGRTHIYLDVNKDYAIFWEFSQLDKTTETDVLMSSTTAKITAGNNINFNGTSVENRGAKIIAGNIIIGDEGVQNNAIEGLKKVTMSGRQAMHYTSGGKGRFADPIEYTEPSEHHTFDLLSGTKLDHQTVTATDVGIVVNDLTKTDVNSETITATEQKDQKTSQLTADQSNITTKTNELGHIDQNGQSNEKVSVNTSQIAVDETSVKTEGTNSEIGVNENLTLKQDQQQKDYSAEVVLTRLDANTTIQTVIQPNQVKDTEQLNKADQQTGEQTQVESNASKENIQFEIRTLDQSNKVPNIGLFRKTPDSKAGYLIETDPEYTQYKKWISSDYMLNNLGLDPSLQQKRLGDGFYEQKLVQDQIAQLTGRRFIDGHASNDDQYKALMNNGLTFAKQYGLRPGIALSAEQMSHLTSDIVWLVEKTVTLPDGTVTTALVPQVYIRAQVGDLQGDGTLISANQIEFKTKEAIKNTGTIAGRDLVSLKANDIENSGKIRAATIGLVAKQDINNIGGHIQADHKLVMDAGRDINNSSLVREGRVQTEHAENSSTYIDRVGSIQVGKVGSTATKDDINLIMNAGRDIHVKAGAIENTTKGASVLQAVGDINIQGVNEERKVELYGNSKNYASTFASNNIGSQIATVGNLNLQGNNIAVIGSSIGSQEGVVQLIAKDKVNIQEGRDILANENTYAYQSKGFLSKSSATGHTSVKTDTAVASSIEGKKVIIDANNVAIRGSHIVSDELTQIQAKENVSITAAENHNSVDAHHDEKKSGFSASLSGGVASVGYGKSNLKTQNNGESTTLTQSVIHSQKGDTTIIAGKDLTAQAAILNAGKDLNLQGANVNLTAGYETNNQHSAMQSKNSGFAVGMTYSPVVAAASTYQKNMKDNQYSDSAVGKVMAHGDAVAKAGMAAQTPIVLTASNQKTSRTQDSSSSQAVVTQASAKGNLNIIAKEGSINSQGAQLSAEGDALLHAKDTINLSFATDHQDQSAKSQTKGFSIDNRDWSAPAGIYNNNEKGQAQLDKVTGTQLSVGGKTKLQTEKGDINILGSSVAGQGDVNIHAARDVNIKSTQNSQSQSESSTNKGIGSAQISDTEKFFGYMKGSNQSNSQSVEQQRSQVGSLGGSVNIVAGNNYTQQVVDVVANKDVSITAKQIKVLDDHNTSSAHQSSDDLKVGVFTKVSSPILDAIGAVDKAANSKADDRTQALQTLAAGAQTYQSYSDVQGGAFFKAEAGIGFSTKNNKQDSYTATSQQNHITAGGNVNLTSTEGDIHLQNTQVKAKDTINLDSAQHIVLESGQSQQRADGKNSNAGLSVGYGVSVGAENGVYIYGEAGVGKGSNHLDSNTHSLTTLESDRLNIKSKGDTTLTGAKATANRIDADVGGKLHIESLQDQTEQNIKQSSAGGRVQGGYGNVWNASGNFSQSKAQGSSSSVDQQSGLFAGEGGYHVKADSVDLKGGAITSTATKDKNDLTTNLFTFSNVENKSQYDATSVSLSGGAPLGKAGAGKTTDGAASNPTNNDNWRNATSFSPSLPQHKSDKDSSTTYATLSDGNITIGGKKTTVEQLGIHTDINTANNKVDTLPNLQNILDNQKTVADATSTIVAAARTYEQNQIKQATAEKEKIQEQLQTALLSPEEREKFKTRPQEEKEAFYSHSADYVAAVAKEKLVTEKWGIGGPNSRALNAVTIAITGALGGQTDLQVAANSLSPYAAQLIGEQWGHGEDKNKAAQLTAHAILGATLAYVNGGNPAAGGSAAVAAESAADYLSKPYKDNPDYQNANGEFEANRLPENVKAQIRDLTAAISAVVGGTVGDSAFNAQLAGVVGQNAVENNFLNDQSLKRRRELIQKANVGGLSEQEAKQLLAINAIDTYADKLIQAYSKNPKSLNEKQLKELAVLVNMASNEDPIVAKKLLADARFYGNLASMDSYSGEEMKKAVTKAQWTLSYYNSMDYKLGVAGQDALFATPGGFGTVMRTAGAAVGAYNVGYGTAAIADGKYREGVVHVVGGTLAIVPSGAKGIINNQVAQKSLLELHNTAERQLLNEISKFSSINQASKVATMVAAYDPVTKKITIGNSNAKVSAESLHPNTVKYIEKKLGVKIGEFTSFCKNKAGACAEVSAADKLVRQGVNPSRIQFTDAVRPRETWKKTSITEKAIIPPCENCKITWPK